MNAFALDWSIDISFLCPPVCLTSIIVFILASAAAGSTLELRLLLAAPMFSLYGLRLDVPILFVRSLAKITKFGLSSSYFLGDYAIGVSFPTRLYIAAEVMFGCVVFCVPEF